MRLSKKQLFPVAALLIGVALSALLVATQPEVEAQPIVKAPPLVESLTVSFQTVRLTVETQGTVVPRRQSELIPQVSGEVVWVSPALAAGGFFEAAEPLLRIDRLDYEAELESARAALTRAESETSQALKQRDRQRRLADRSIASQARIDDAENAHRVAAAMLREAKAALSRAERNLARTELAAPYTGRVRSENVDVGQFASRGSSLASIYAVDYAEVRLPLPDRELRYLNVPLGYRAEAAAADGSSGAEVTLTAEFAGRVHEWAGRIVRSEGEIDPRTRMVTLVARVEAPYEIEAGSNKPPLAVGLFVEATIRGLTLPEAIVLPRNALQDGDNVLIIDAEDRLYFRPVEVLRREHDRIVIASGITAGERVCTSQMPAAIDGMIVRTQATGSRVARVGS